ncbi:MAG TPA: 23S rRNA (guanosine(2251)-2'-O)-methyltransferase RlmB [Firmicutes bacterium]|nr:23S rRNA (guanosine(2251)-2'-O)-methyltransferase RlmB [Bacillota bacterium]
MAEYDWIEGRQPVLEFLKAGQAVNKLLVVKDSRDRQMQRIVALAKEKGIIIQEVDRRYLDKISATGRHQGVAAQIAAVEYAELEELISKPQDPAWPPFLLVLDGLQDPHNLGSLLRSAEAAKVGGVIIPKRRAVGVTPVVAKVSAGALSYVPVARVVNIPRAIDDLKEAGYWIVGADMDGELCYEQDLTGPIALVVGGEGEGLSRLVKEKCDFLARIPMLGQINSLNAGVAGALLMFEVVRQRTQSHRGH